MVRSEDTDYGSSHAGDGIKVDLEFISANPTGPMHLGHGRWAALGDAMANVLSFAGYDVTREFYINDAGNQMDIFAESVAIRYLQVARLITEGAADNVEDACRLIIENMESYRAELPENCYAGALSLLHISQRKGTWRLWGMVVIGCVPAAIVGLLFDDWVTEHLHNAWVVAAMLILYGVIFIVLERRNRRLYVQYIHDTGQLDHKPSPDEMFSIKTVDEIGPVSALKIGLFLSRIHI